MADEPKLSLLVPRDTTPPPREPSLNALSGTAQLFSPGSIMSIMPGSVLEEVPPPGTAVGSDEETPGELETSEKDADSGPEKRLGPPTKKARANPPVQRKKEGPALLIQSDEIRAQKARRSGNVLQRKAQDYLTSTGAKVFLKTSYQFKNGAYLNFTVGEDFRMPTDTKCLDAAEIASTVSSTVSQTISSIFKPPASSPKQGASSSLFSPAKSVPEVADPNKCIVCKQKEIVKDLFRFKSEWIGCSEKDCGKWAHADCVGFPGLTPNEVKKMPNYYCPEHVSTGRMRRGSLPDYVEPPTSVRGRGRQTQAGAEQNQESVPPVPSKGTRRRSGK